MDITLWLVGVDEDDAMSRWPFDSEDSANSYQNDNEGSKIYTVKATLDFSTMEEVD